MQQEEKQEQEDHRYGNSDMGTVPDPK